MTEVHPNPVTAPRGPSELMGMNEATGDIVAMLAELVRDAVVGGQPATTIDRLPLQQRHLDMGELSGRVVRNILDPLYEEWFEGIGDVDPHASGGPISRMFVLLAYGCAPMVPSAPRTMYQCPRIPEGFSGVGPTAAARPVGKVVTTMAPDPLRRRAPPHLNAATLEDGVFGGPLTKAAADAFAAVNVGQRADRRPPLVSFSCTQLDGLHCVGAIHDDETPDQFSRPPEIVLDANTTFTIGTGWSFAMNIPSSALTDGLHTLKLRAWDAWNNEGTQTIVVDYDKQGPFATITRTGPPKRPTLQVSASDPNGIAWCEFFEGSVSLGVVPPGRWRRPSTRRPGATATTRSRSSSSTASATRTGQRAVRADNTRRRWS